MDSDDSLSPLVVQHLDVFACPACGGILAPAGDRSRIECAGCRRVFPCRRGIPLLYWAEDAERDGNITDAVKAFYEQNPFPGYEDTDSKWTLKQKAERGVFARLLDEQIPHGARVLEVGCGTGQLSNFLGIKWGRLVFGADMCLNSLSLGQAFRSQNRIDNVAFLQMNLYRPVFKPASFDVVICNGVLPVVADPFRGFQRLVGMVKPGGFLVIGLYNRYGRIPTDIRRLVFRATGDRFTFLDPRLRAGGLSNARKRIWFMDQYKVPHERKHTIEDALRWFDRCGVDFVTSIPKAAGGEFSSQERVFEPHARGTAVDHAIVQLRMLVSGGAEGGFFTMIGRRRP